MTLLSEFELHEDAPVYQGTASPEAIEITVGKLYSEVVHRYSTYEAVVRSHFCQRMREAYGDDENLDPEVQYAFAFARHTYDYVSEEELLEIEAEDSNNGICSHGLNWLTCPCGCFEVD
ncbi:hypothetical protein CSV86_018295 [Pseudomonas putida CSV86]|uniref:Uncharacterized protein n=1 Tax=Pseudomonas bharatica CSV86 TaxID=1005395 RepID=L1M1J9_9PSED|nr:hypothetical protein [Pseudomonas bharatica]NNJ17008.1 hypothetical protein [Pseudomonas bharatica CSV86]